MQINALSAVSSLRSACLPAVVAPPSRREGLVLRAMASGRGRPLEVVSGSSAPRTRGDSWHYTTRGGKRIEHPSAYAKSGWSNMVYVRSTHRVEVGEEWLATWRLCGRPGYTTSRRGLAQRGVYGRD